MMNSEGTTGPSFDALLAAWGIARVRRRLTRAERVRLAKTQATSIQTRDTRTWMNTYLRNSSLRAA